MANMLINIVDLIFSPFRLVIWEDLFCFRAVHLRDLILLHTALPDQVEGTLINFRKMVQLSQTLKELTKLQIHDTIPFTANVDLVNTLRVCPDQLWSRMFLSCTLM
jgi:hypothetical protein